MKKPIIISDYTTRDAKVVFDRLGYVIGVVWRAADFDEWRAMSGVARANITIRATQGQALDWVWDESQHPERG